MVHVINFIWLCLLHRQTSKCNKAGGWKALSQVVETQADGSQAELKSEQTTKDTRNAAVGESRWADTFLLYSIFDFPCIWIVTQFC